MSSESSSSLGRDVNLYNQDATTVDDEQQTVDESFSSANYEDNCGDVSDFSFTERSIDSDFSSSETSESNDFSRTEPFSVFLSSFLFDPVLDSRLENYQHLTPNEHLLLRLQKFFGNSTPTKRVSRCMMLKDMVQNHTSLCDQLKLLVNNSDCLPFGVASSIERNSFHLWLEWTETQDSFEKLAKVFVRLVYNLDYVDSVFQRMERCGEKKNNWALGLNLLTNFRDDVHLLLRFFREEMFLKGVPMSAFQSSKFC
jgi:hypothetical protein